MAPDPSVLSTLRAVRALYPTTRPLTRQELGAMLNTTAWLHRAEGVGLERKVGGFTGEQPRSGLSVASDILRFRDNVGRDVLNDADGAATPQWGDAGAASAATFLAPVEPLPGTIPGQTPEPWVPVVADLVTRVEAIESNLTSLVAHVGRIGAELHQLRSGLSEHGVTPALLGATLRDLWERLLKVEEVVQQLRAGVSTSRALGHTHRVQL